MNRVETVIANMRILRKHRRWSAQQLADKLTTAGCHTTRGVIANIETGRKGDMTATQLFAVADVFGLTVDDLCAPMCDACHGSPPAGFQCRTCGATA